MTQGALPVTAAGPGSAAPAACPECGHPGRRVGSVTPKALLTPAALGRAGAAEGLRFCRTPECDVIYFAERRGGRFGVPDLRGPVFQKSADPGRLVCYCFDHAVDAIREEVARTGGSRVPDSIAEKCRQGLDRCAETNPQGTCCLGNVREVVSAAVAAVSTAGSVTVDGARGAEAQAPSAVEDCCGVEAAAFASLGPASSVTGSPASAAGSGARASLLSAGGALAAAALSSACCWLPLLLIGFGVSAVGVAGFFEAYRGAFLAGAGLLLGAGFYFAYWRQPHCAPGDACAAPDPRLRRLTRASLWAAAAAVAALAAFPSYVDALLAGPPVVARADAASADPAGPMRRYAISGMTCEGCAGGVRAALEGLAGVASAEVSYAEGRASVRLRRGAALDDDEVAATVAALGYRAAPVADATRGLDEEEGR